MNTFYQFANKLASISEEEFEHFKPHLDPKNFKANTIICNIGDEAKYLYFIKSGVVRTSTIRDNAKFSQEHYIQKMNFLDHYQV